MARAVVTGVLLLVVSVMPALAAEVIQRFHSDIEVHADGSMRVTERITVVAEGQRIRRGIYREFPTRYKDRLGHYVNVEFRLLETKRDRRLERNHVESMRNGLVVYLGDADVLLPPGRYTYEIQYETDFQLGFFEGFDELYWNVTGNGWVFPIQQASATVTLPADVAETELRIAAYTGQQGVDGTDYESRMERNGSVTFQATRSLAPYEGLTIALGFPKQIVTEPTATQKLSRFISNNAGILAGLGGTGLVFVYYLMVWRRLGRDPDRGIIIPRYEPPEGYSPASLRYIWRMKYDSTAFAAALVNLSVKEKVQIKSTKKLLSRQFSVTQDKDKQIDYSPGEAALFKRLFGAKKTVKFETENHARIKGALTVHESALRKDYAKKYFILNQGKIAVGLVLSGITIVVMVVLGAFPSAGAFVVTVFLAIYNLLMVRWMKAPTVRGRKLMDQIEGLRLYLGVAERQDLERRQEPPATLEEFERLLPFAVALDCANTWVDRFEDVLKRLEGTGELNSRGWYTGSGNMTARGITSSVNGLSSGLSRSIASSSTPPGSSSGSGGGGFSGGGGGGGGGGGW